MKFILPPYKAVLFLFIIISNVAFAQNLVVNPSFEVTSSNCGNFGGEGFFTDLTGSWDNASNNAGGDSCSSPDLFSACNTLPIPGFGSPTAMPNSVLGYQYSHTGTRHAGIITYEALDEYREYIQGRLTTPLVAGQTYCVSMFVSLANEMPYATNNMGVYFSNNQYLRDPCPGQTQSAIYVTPQLNYTCSPITDTSANWFRLQWNYVATGGERWFVIGNFFNNANTVIANTGKSPFPNPFAYYYIDDVSVIPNTCCYAEIQPHADVCPTAAPFNLTVTGGTGGSGCTPTLNGTWAGPGITSASQGTFSAAVAGVGTHAITYSLPCGYTDTMRIVVGACTPLSVCRETNGSLTVSGGVGPFRWDRIYQVQNCSACLPAFPPIITACSTPPGCAVMVDTFASFATGTNATPPSYPVRVVDLGQTDSLVRINASGDVPPCSVTCTLSATATPTATTCGSANGNVTVIANGGTATGYAWSNGGTTASISSLAAGNYTVTVSGGGCSATASAVVASSTGITASATSTPAGCTNNGTATVTISGGTAQSYIWSNSQATSAISNLSGGTYTVTVTSSANCTATASTTVAVTGGAILLSATSANATCNNNNGSATVTVAQGTATGYVWSSGATTATANNLAAGSYTVTVTGSGGCSATAGVTVNATGAPAITTSNTSAGCSANNGSATVTVTQGTATGYAWSNGGSTATISNLAGGNYTVTVTGTGGCTVTASVTVNQATGLVISASSVNTSCGNNNGSATVTVTQGTPTSYNWSNGNTSASIVNVAAGNYTVTVSDAGGCSATASVTVGGSGGNNVVVTSDKNIMCVGDSANVCATTGYAAYLWNNGMNTSCIFAKQAGNYYVTVTDAGGCTATSNHLSISVYQQPPVSISVNGDSLVAYNSLTYQWYRNGVLIPGATNAVYVPTQSGSYTVVVGDANGCTAQSLPVVMTVTGIAQLSKDNMTVYPNPNNSNQWSITVSEAWLGAVCEVFDATGRTVYVGELKNQRSDINLEIASGVYMLRLSSGNRVAVQKLIKL